MPGQYVIIEFDEVRAYTNDFPQRFITLSAPSWEARVGRSSASNLPDQAATASNALFNSRVVSREHAKLTANPLTRTVYITDLNSMHGSYIDGHRLQSSATPLLDGVEVTFGTSVERVGQGEPERFEPVTVNAYITWSEDSHSYDEPPCPAPVAQNSFSADYSDEEPLYSSDDEEQDMDYPPSPIVIEETSEYARTFTVPSSDMSDDAISIDSEEEDACPVESPTSSPYSSIDLTKDLTSAKGVATAKPTLINTSSQENPIIIDHESDRDSLYENSSVFDGDLDDEREQGAPPESIKTHLQLPSTATKADVAARQPSPSDAAMVKPSAPAAHDTFKQMPSTMPKLSEHINGGYYQPNPPSPFYYPAEIPHPWSNQGYSSQSQPIHNNTGLLGQLTYFSDPYDVPKSSPNSSPVVDSSNRETGGYDSPPPASAQLTSWPSRPADAAVNLGQAAANFSVPALQKEKAVDSRTAMAPGLVIFDTAQSDNSSRKRKADQISSIESFSATEKPVVNHEQTPGEALPKSKLPKTHPSETASTEAALKSITVPVDLSSQPPRKRAKRDNAGAAAAVSRSSAFVQLATATMTGVAIGAVGAVLGLASLPEGFFM